MPRRVSLGTRVHEPFNTFYKIQEVAILSPVCVCYLYLVYLD